MTDSEAQRARGTVPSSRGKATARRISASAVALVLEHGYDATTVDMICAAAEVSQRTFFNHFPTKDASIIGTHGPQLDELRVREFITGGGPHILADALELIAASLAESAPDAQFMRDRLRAITSSAVLMQRQVEQFAAIERELTEIIKFRLAKVSSVDESTSDIVEQSRLTAHLLAGIMRYTASAVAGDEHVPIADAVRDTRRHLAALLPKLAGA